MIEQETIDALIGDLYVLTELEKNAKKNKDELREKLFAIASESYEGKEYLLPITTITIPNSFWHSTEITPEEFVESRFPTWDVTHVEPALDTDETTFILRKKPEYMPYSYEGQSHKVSKQAVEPTPEIDWESLNNEFPEIFTKIAKEVVSYELDEQGVAELQKEIPDFMSILQRHVKVTRKPQQRVSVKEL